VKALFFARINAALKNCTSNNKKMGATIQRMRLSFALYQQRRLSKKAAGSLAMNASATGLSIYSGTPPFATTTTTTSTITTHAHIPSPCLWITSTDFNELEEKEGDEEGEEEEGGIDADVLRLESLDECDLSNLDSSSDNDPFLSRGWQQAQ
jgi:hypothetical protein